MDAKLGTGPGSTRLNRRNSQQQRDPLSNESAHPIDIKLILRERSEGRRRRRDYSAGLHFIIILLLFSSHRRYPGESETRVDRGGGGWQVKNMKEPKKTRV